MSRSVECFGRTKLGLYDDSEQIGVGSGTGENDSILAEKAKQEPIVFDMAFGETAVIARKLMRPATFRQGFFAYYSCQNVNKLIHAIMAFFEQPKIFLELVGKPEVKHRLSVQLFPKLLNGVEPFARYFSAGHVPGFLHGCQRLGIERRVFGMKGAVPIDTIRSDSFWFGLCSDHMVLLDLPA